ncbi:uncharacterized protein ACIBXB_017680 isoform 2-T2 [Morphnus guianensis]
MKIQEDEFQTKFGKVLWENPIHCTPEESSNWQELYRVARDGLLWHILAMDATVDWEDKAGLKIKQTGPSLQDIIASLPKKVNRFVSPSPFCSPGLLQNPFCKGGPEGAQHLPENPKCHERQGGIYGSSKFWQTHREE